jgi:hypothetical protein
VALPNSGQGSSIEGLNFARQWGASSIGQQFDANKGIGTVGDNLFGSLDNPIPITPSAPYAFSPDTAGKALGRQSSVAYMAVIRRREAQAIREQFVQLEQNAQREDLVMMALPITSAIRDSLDRIAGAETEGNSREILRRLRDSLLNGGWNNYRSQEATRAAIEAIDFLSNANQVTPSDVRRLSSAMQAAGLGILDVPLLSADDEDLGFDEED